MHSLSCLSLQKKRCTGKMFPKQNRWHFSMRTVKQLTSESTRFHLSLYLNLIAHVQQTATCGALYSILYHHLYPFWDTCYSSKDTIQNLAATTQKTIYALSQMHMYVDLISQSGLPQTIPHTKVGMTTNDIWRFTSSNCFLRNGLNWVLSWSFPKQYIKTLAITVVSYVPRLTSIHHDGEPP